MSFCDKTCSEFIEVLSSKAPVYNSSKKFGVKIAVNAYYK